MDVTNRYVLDFAKQFAERQPGARILDYGCGAGRLVRAGLDAGLAFSGADVFYAGSNARTEADAAGLLGCAIHEIVDGRLPFPDAHFHLVVNNQVMEHVEDLDAALAEIHRVLKPGGQVLSLFPSRDVLREGHIGIPLSHRLPRNSRLRFCYTWALRALGLGYHKAESPTSRQWAIDKLNWIDTYTVYRTRRQVFTAYGRHFTSELREMDYIRYRLLSRPGRGWLLPFLRLPLAAPLAEAVFRKLAFLVILSQKEPV
ncbi:MAG: methyltransferase domain-containing protein [Bryobacterales bacterium]|nr:methyltransferase domain-containing protein [Bryobacterales bacterium]